MEFSQILECKRNVFLKNHTQNMVENVRISMVQQSETLSSFFLFVCSS